MNFNVGDLNLQSASIKDLCKRQSDYFIECITDPLPKEREIVIRKTVETNFLSGLMAMYVMLTDERHGLTTVEQMFHVARLRDECIKYQKEIETMEMG